MRKLNINHKTVFDTITAVKQAIEVSRQIREFINNRRDDTSFRISLRESDQAYQQAHNWLLSLIPEDSARKITAITTKNGLKILYDAKESVEVEVEGHKVEVNIETPEPPVKSGSGLEPMGSVSTIGRSMVFRCKNAAGVEAVKRLLNELHEASRNRPATLYTPAKWDNWGSCGPANRRPLESIVLRSGLMEELVADLDKFISAEERYIDLGIPFHRGYLFYGPPGTGKTSVARALAAKVGGDVYALSLNAVKNNNELNEMIREVNIQEGGCAALVLEDIDVVHSTQARETQDDDSSGITLDGLLNVLDGMFTPNGIIVFMTTNRIEGFDDALIRPGRVDMTVEIDYLDDDQFKRLCATFLPADLDLPRVDPEMAISPADIIGIFKKHINEPYEAHREVVDFVLERVYARD